MLFYIFLSCTRRIAVVQFCKYFSIVMHRSVVLLAGALQFTVGWYAVEETIRFVCVIHLAAVVG